MLMVKAEVELENCFLVYLPDVENFCISSQRLSFLGMSDQAFDCRFESQLLSQVVNYRLPESMPILLARRFVDSTLGFVAFEPLGCSSSPFVFGKGIMYFVKESYSASDDLTCSTDCRNFSSSIMNGGWLQTYPNVINLFDICHMKRAEFLESCSGRECKDWKPILKWTFSDSSPFGCGQEVRMGGDLKKL
jgi:hypothetical protein